MRPPDTNADPHALGLSALIWTLEEPDRAQRLLGVTGLDPRDLRARVGEPAVLAACLSFLEANEADLVACADELGTAPQALVRAREALEA